MTREQELSFSILCSQYGWHKARIQEARDEIRNLIKQQAKRIAELDADGARKATTITGLLHNLSVIKGELDLVGEDECTCLAWDHIALAIEFTEQAKKGK